MHLMQHQIQDLDVHLYLHQLQTHPIQVKLKDLLVLVTLKQIFQIHGMDHPGWHKHCIPRLNLFKVKGI